MKKVTVRIESFNGKDEKEVTILAKEELLKVFRNLNEQDVWEQLFDTLYGCAPMVYRADISPFDGDVETYGMRRDNFREYNVLDLTIMQMETFDGDFDLDDEQVIPYDIYEKIKSVCEERFEYDFYNISLDDYAEVRDHVLEQENLDLEELYYEYIREFCGVSMISEEEFNEMLDSLYENVIEEFEEE